MARLSWLVTHALAGRHKMCTWKCGRSWAADPRRQFLAACFSGVLAVTAEVETTAPTANAISDRYLTSLPSQLRAFIVVWLNIARVSYAFRRRIDGFTVSTVGDGSLLHAVELAPVPARRRADRHRHCQIN